MPEPGNTNALADTQPLNAGPHGINAADNLT